MNNLRFNMVCPFYKKKMYAMFVSFHSNNVVIFRITDIVYLLFYIVDDGIFK